MTIERILLFSHRQIKPSIKADKAVGRQSRQIEPLAIGRHGRQNKILYNLYRYECQNRVIINYII